MSEGDRYVKPQLAQSDNGLVHHLTEAAHQFAYSALQQPLDGVRQLANDGIKAMTGAELPTMNLISAPRPAVPYSADWYAHLFGGGFGSVVPFLASSAVANGMVKGLSRISPLAPLIEDAGLLKAHSISTFALRGALYEGVFHPVDEEGGDILLKRTKNAAAGALTFAALRGMDQQLRGTRWGLQGLNSEGVGKQLFSDLTIRTVSGAAAGITDPLSRSLMNWEAPHASDLIESATQYAIMSPTAHVVIESIGGAREVLPAAKGAAGDAGQSGTQAGSSASTAADKPMQGARQAEKPVATPVEPSSPDGQFDWQPENHRFGYSKGIPYQYIGKESDSGKNLFFRNMPELDERQADRTISRDEFAKELKPFTVNGKEYGLDRAENKVYRVRAFGDVVELDETDAVKVDLDEDALQVPWLPMQLNDDHNVRPSKAPRLLNDLMIMRAKPTSISLGAGFNFKTDAGAAPTQGNDFTFVPQSKLIPGS